MNQEIKSVLKKTAKIAGTTCFVAGAVAIVTSGVAVKAVGEGGKYLVDAVKKIITGQDQPQEILEAEAEASEEDFAAAEEAPADPEN